MKSIPAALIVVVAALFILPGCPKKEQPKVESAKDYDRPLPPGAFACLLALSRPAGRASSTRRTDWWMAVRGVFNSWDKSPRTSSFSSSAFLRSFPLHRHANE